MSVTELKKDIEELNALLAQATRTRVKDILGIEIRKLQTILINKEGETQDKGDNASTGASANSSVSKPKTQLHTYQLNTYAWDQSDKFMKIYVTLNGIQKASKESIKCLFTDKSVKLLISNFDNKNYELYISNLYDSIIVESSYYKLKTDTVLLMLKKKEEGKTWGFVTKQKEKEIKKPDLDENKDPSDSMMTMLKQMYDEGDDEMKRTIAKSWSESKGKQPGMM